MPSQRSRQKPQILLVDWNDTASPESSEWKDIDEDTLDGVARVRSIGYLGHRDKKQIILIQTVSEDGGFFGELAIPMGCVTKIRRLH
jgi:hypothetical protein